MTTIEMMFRATWGSHSQTFDLDDNHPEPDPGTALATLRTSAQKTCLKATICNTVSRARSGFNQFVPVCASVIALFDRG